MRLLDLFSGIGGISLAADWAGMQTVAFCEIEPFPQRVLRKHWPDVPIIPDVHDVTRKELDRLGVGAIDLISIGDPCQPYSVAGKREGKDDDRFLWPQARRVVEEIRPRWVVRENVPGNITMGLDGVLDEMEALDYAAWPIVFPAAAVGASHKRDRLFVVGYTERGGCSRQSWGRAESKPADGYRGVEGGAMADTTGERFPEWGGAGIYQESTQVGTRQDNRSERCSETLADSPGKGDRRLPVFTGQSQQTDTNAYRGGKDVADASGTGCEERNVTAVADRSGYGAVRSDAGGGADGAAQSGMGRSVDVLPAWLDGSGLNPLDTLAAFIASYPQPALMGQPQYDWEPPRVATGVKNRAARLKALGNAVSPLQIYPILAAIKHIDDMMR